MGMIEVLIDETKTDKEQLIIDRGELTVPDNSESRSTNNGPLKLGGGSNYLLTTFEKFSFIKGYTLCPYDQVVLQEGSTVCTTLEPN